MLSGLLLLVAACSAETSPAIERGADKSLQRVTPLQADHLFVLGKVWGFLKYHHPRVTGGEIDWDAELMRVLPSFMDADSVETRHEVLTTWLEELGPAPACQPCARIPSGLELMADIEWLGDRELLGERASDSLAHTYRNRHAQGAQHYVDTAPGTGNALFEHEPADQGGRLPDTGQRLLALYRFWNIIEYWFPYREIIGEDWGGVLRESVPRFVAADERDIYAQELLRLIARVHDTHANLWSALHALPPMGPCQLPVLFRFVEGRPTVIGNSHPEWGPASGLRTGDVLLALDGQPIEDLIEKWAPFYPASNLPTRQRDMARWMGRGECGEVQVTVDRDGETLELMSQRAPGGSLDSYGDQSHSRPGDAFQWLCEDVAYLSLANIRIEDVRDHLDEAERAAGLVIDIRNYPSDFVVFELGQYLVKEETPFVRFSRPSLSNPGVFTLGAPLRLVPRRPHFERPIMILVDETTQSQAEYTTMAFRSAPRALVVGSTTAGADGNVGHFNLPGGQRSMISGIGVFYPDLTPTQRVGIVPDVLVRPTRKGLMEDRDEVLEEALRRLLPDTDEASLRAAAKRP